MNIFSFFEVEFQTIINQLVSADLLSGDIDTSRVVFELPRDESHGFHRAVTQRQHGLYQYHQIVNQRKQAGL